MRSNTNAKKNFNSVQENGESRYDKLFETVYKKLKNVAHIQLTNERNGHTLSKTALVHEVYIKLVSQDCVEWKNKAHFFAIAARAMRQVLVDYARKKTAQKREGSRQRVTLNEDILNIEQHAEDLIALNDLIDKMARFDERKSKVVEMRFFAGMTIPEIAELLEVSTRTIDRDWLKARTWIRKELQNA